MSPDDSLSGKPQGIGGTSSPEVVYPLASNSLSSLTNPTRAGLLFCVNDPRRPFCPSKVEKVGRIT